MSASIRCTGIVLDRMPYKEYDRLYTLLTLERGLVFTRARGAAKPLAKVRPHLEGFGVIDAMLVKGRAGYLLASAEMVEPLRMKTLERQLLAASARKVLARLLREHAPDAEVFGLLRGLLRDLSGGVSDDQLLAREIHFFWSLLGALGYNGNVDRCNRCGQALDGTAKFVPLAGAFFCEACASPAGVLVSSGLRDYLKVNHGLIRANGRMVEREIGEFGAALQEHFTHRLEMAYPTSLYGNSGSQRHR